MKTLNAGYDELSFISNIFYSIKDSVIFFINYLEFQLLYFIACILLFFFLKNKNQNFVNSFICFAIILFNLIFSYNLTTPLLSLIFTLFLLFFNNYKKILLNIHERKLTKFIILFCFIPFLFSFGTNNNLISHGFYILIFIFKNSQFIVF